MGGIFVGFMDWLIPSGVTWLAKKSHEICANLRCIAGKKIDLMGNFPVSHD
jgi:hypothetical protein